MCLQKIGKKGWLVMALAGAAMVLQSCMKNDVVETYDFDAILFQDIQTIQEYLNTNNIDAEFDSTYGVFYEIHNSGTGYKSALKAEIEVNFQGFTLDGLEFANTFNSDPETIVLEGNNTSEIITNGLIIGLANLHAGDSVTIYSPSPYGFQNRSYNDVPPNSILVYNTKFYRFNHLEEDYIKIDQHITENNWTASIEPEYGIRYVIHKAGDPNIKAELGNYISLDYQGELFDGTIFDSSFDKTTTLDFTLGENSLIVGFDAGVSQLHKKDSATIFIPSDFGYGKNGSGTTIPPDALLKFGLDILTISK